VWGTAKGLQLTVKPATDEMTTGRRGRTEKGERRTVEPTSFIGPQRCSSQSQWSIKQNQRWWEEVDVVRAALLSSSHYNHLRFQKSGPVYPAVPYSAPQRLALPTAILNFPPLVPIKFPSPAFHSTHNKTPPAGAPLQDTVQSFITIATPLRERRPSLMSPPPSPSRSHSSPLLSSRITSTQSHKVDDVSPVKGRQCTASPTRSKTRQSQPASPFFSSKSQTPPVDRCLSLNPVLRAFSASHGCPSASFPCRVPTDMPSFGIRTQPTCLEVDKRRTSQRSFFPSSLLLLVFVSPFKS
jgi:hypothetical protein